jgi:chromosome segregation protein
VSECRKKGLDAVAITDHHDLCYFPYITTAAHNATDPNGDPYPPEKQLIVFPGMELTLGVPWQAILILDSDFPVSELRTLYTALACAQQDHSANKSRLWCRILWAVFVPPKHFRH